MRMKTRSSPGNGEMIQSTHQSVTESSSTKPDGDYESVKDLRLKLQNCQEENLKLQAVITDLTQVNKRWQKYNNDRQIYVQKLLNTIQDQQEQLNLIGERSCMSSTPQGSTSSSNENDEELQRLRSAEQRLKEKVSVLEFQVKAHRDDWEAELNEKKQALKDKEHLEEKITHLLSTTPARSSSTLFFCQTCGHVTDHIPTSRSRVYRTAVHLPCSSSQHSSSNSLSTNGGDLVIDSEELRPELSSGDVAGAWEAKTEESSYSRSSTVPLGTPQGTTNLLLSTDGASASLTDHNSVLVKSSVQIPITKSSSVPEGRTPSKLPELPSTSLDFFKPTHEPPLTVINSAEQYDGVETFSAENVICLRCGEVFPPTMHLKFLNHFPKCQANRTRKSASEGDSKR